MDDYIPTTEVVRNVFATDFVSPNPLYAAECEAAYDEFERWLNGVKADILHEVADLYDTLQTSENDHYSRRDPSLWLHDEANRFEESPPMADEYTPVTREIGIAYVCDSLGAGIDEAEARRRFQRWLVAHDAKVREVAAQRIYAALSGHSDDLDATLTQVTLAGP